MRVDFHIRNLPSCSVFPIVTHSLNQFSSSHSYYTTERVVACYPQPASTATGRNPIVTTMTVEPSPPVASSNGDVAGAGSAILSSSGSIMPSTTARTVRPSSIEKPRYRPSVVGGDRKMTGKDLHDVFKTSTTDLAVITDEQVARVQRMHEMFVEGAAFSFNYNTMVLVAATLAGLGLASNSVATIIASMLVSPIMGPVVGMVR